jgi:NAD(P)-dependent dehydrogenase (short-subunit alcohol dehydrogenase family)
VAADVADEQDIRAAVAHHRERHGRLDVHTRSMNRELAGEGIKSVALCPGFVDTDMSDFIKGSIPAEEMLRPRDIAEALRFLLRVSPSCVVPQIIFERPGEAI